MTTSSSEARPARGRVIRGADLAAVSGPAPAAVSTPELRTGSWTRLGSPSVLGDVVTEATLGTLAEQAQAAGQAQGYAVGWAAGTRDAAAAARAEQEAAAVRLAEAEQRRAVEHDQAVQSLARAAAALTAATDQVAALVEERALALALAVTEAVLGAQAAAAVPADVVRRAVAVLPPEGTVRLRLSPAVAASPAVADLPSRVTPVADPTLGPADAVAEVEDSLVDLRVATALRRVTEALREQGGLA